MQVAEFSETVGTAELQIPGVDPVMTIVPLENVFALLMIVALNTAADATLTENNTQRRDVVEPATNHLGFLRGDFLIFGF